MKTAIAVFFTVFGADQLSKWYILENYNNPSKIDRITDFFNILLAWNRGVSFSFFAEGGDYTPYILSALTAAITLGIIIWAFREKDFYNRLFLAMIAGGALGNLTDRIRFKAVIDFLDFYIGEYHWPAFNVADSAISVGAILFLVYSYMKNFKTKESEEK